MKRIALIGLISLLAACDSMPSWMGGDDDKPKLPGTRIAVLADTTSLKADESLKDTQLSLPPQQANESWPQAMGNAASHLEHVALAGAPKPDKTAKIGEGNAWKEKFFTAPIVAGQVLFAMDAYGYVSAHATSDIAHVAWVSKAATEKDEPVLGGGLAFDNGMLFVVNGYGRVIALAPEDGHEIWRQSLGVPVRVAPKAASGRLVVLTVDNQAIALSQDKGETLWSHRGISEAAEFISDTSPSILDKLVVVPMSSGMIAGLDFDTGKELWTDSLILARRTAAAAIFAGIGGSPVITNDAVFAVSNNGMLVATSPATGQRLWEQDISSNQTPWVAGDYVFALSTGNVLAAASSADGRIKWAQQLPQYENEDSKKHPIFWHGPVLAGERLWLAGSHGKMLGVSPQAGTVDATVDIASDVVEAPVVANGVLYLVTKDAVLHSYK